MNKDKWFFRPAFYIIMTLYFVVGYTTLGYGEKWAGMLYPEDYYFENIGAISLAIASVISLYVFLQAVKNHNVANIHWFKLLVYLGLALLYFFGAGEEISWGQRIFNIAEPAALGQINVQGETNVHNLAVFENSDLLKADTVFNVFLMIFTILIPAAGYTSKRSKQFLEKLTPLVHWGIGLLYILNYLGAKIVKPFYVESYTYQPIAYLQAIQEIKESNYEVLFIFLSLVVLWDLQQLIKKKAKIPQVSIKSK